MENHVGIFVIRLDFKTHLIISMDPIPSLRIKKELDQLRPNPFTRTLYENEKNYSQFEEYLLWVSLYEYSSKCMVNKLIVVNGRKIVVKKANSDL